MSVPTINYMDEDAIMVHIAPTIRELFIRHPNEWDKISEECGIDSTYCEFIWNRLVSYNNEKQWTSNDDKLMRTYEELYHDTKIIASFFFNATPQFIGYRLFSIKINENNTKPKKVIRKRRRHRRKYNLDVLCNVAIEELRKYKK